MTERHDTQPEPDRDEELFVEFANTLHGPGGSSIDDVAEAPGLRAWLDARRLGGDAGTARIDRALPAFRELRALVRDTTERLAAAGRPSPAQVRRLNRVLRDGLHYHQLRPAADDGSHFTVGQVGDELDQARAAIAGSLAHFVADHDVDRLRICGADDCGWRFVDRSPAGRRRWCDMRTCGNRAKVARHRARAREAAAQS